jgi:hypothetical protein
LTALFTAPETSAPRTLPKWLAPSGGLLAAAAIAYLGISLPPRGTLSWPELLQLAAGRLALVFVACSATVWSFRLLRRANRAPDAEVSVLRTSLAAIWFVPIVILLREGSGWAAAITAFVSGSATRSFRPLHGSYNVVGVEEQSYLSLFADDAGLPNSPHRHGHLFGAVIMVLLAEVATVASFAGAAFIAAIMAAISASLWAWFFRDEKPASHNSGHAKPKGVITFALAVLVTVACLIPYLKHARGSGGLGLFFAGKVGHRAASPGEHKQTGMEETAEKGFESAASGFEDGYSGVVLWSKKRELTHLVAPTPVLSKYEMGTGRSANPLVVPFSGVYWFFKAPNVRPPRGSREVHGSPELVTTRSTDRRPLSMEAHQHLGTMIDLNCCSRIQVAIRNTDRYPETVSLELVLTDTSLSKRPSQSLGNIMVRSTRPWKLYGDRPAVSETLTFEIPSRSTLKRFDEVTVIFHLEPLRADVGAKIGIEKFVLVPRGL